MYKIEVYLYPNNTIDIAKPFFWCLRSCYGKEWCTETAGWESTHEKAWKEAYRFYKEYKCDNAKK